MTPESLRNDKLKADAEIIKKEIKRLKEIIYEKNLEGYNGITVTYSDIVLDSKPIFFLECIKIHFKESGFEVIESLSYIEITLHIRW